MEEAIKFLSGAGGVAVISGLFVVLNATLQRKDERRKEKEKAAKEAKEQEYIVSKAAIDELMERINKVGTDSQKADNEIVLQLKMVSDTAADLLRDRIDQKCDYHLRNGYCTEEDKQKLDILWQNYKAQKRNHLKEKRVQSVFDLPNDPPRDRRKGDG